MDALLDRQNSCENCGNLKPNLRVQWESAEGEAGDKLVHPLPEFKLIRRPMRLAVVSFRVFEDAEPRRRVEDTIPEMRERDLVEIAADREVSRVAFKVIRQ